MIKAADLRSGAAPVLTGLNTEEEATFEDMERIARGYELLEQKLSGLGVTIRQEE